MCIAVTAEDGEDGDVGVVGVAGVDDDTVAVDINVAVVVVVVWMDVWGGIVGEDVEDEGFCAAWTRECNGGC